MYTQGKEITNNFSTAFTYVIFSSFRCGSKTAGQNGERKRRTTRQTYLDKTRVAQLFQAWTDFTKALAPFAMKAPKHRRQFIPITPRTTGVRELQALVTVHCNQQATVSAITLSAKYPNLVPYHHQYRALWVPFQLRCRMTTTRPLMRPVLPAYLAFLAVIRQLMATKNRARCT